MRTDGVPMPLLKFGKVEIAGAYTPRSSPPRSMRTRALTLVFCSAAVDLRTEIGDRVAAHRRRLALVELHLAPRDVAGRRRERDRDDDDADVHDEAAVQPRVAAHHATQPRPEPLRSARAPRRARRCRSCGRCSRSANAASANVNTCATPRAPSSSATTNVIAPAHAGTSRRLRSSSPLAARQGSSGPTAIRNSSAIPIGTPSRSKYGSPTDSWRSCSASASSGNTVPGQHDQREHGEQQVVQQERGFARHRRVDADRAIAARRRATR